MKKIDVVKIFLKGFCFKKKKVFLKNHDEKKPHFALGESEKKYAVFMIFHEIENFFERVFALNDFF